MQGTEDSVRHEESAQYILAAITLSLPGLPNHVWFWLVQSNLYNFT